ncbi:hypothetical protein RISK_006034 [Rhodopirellula islandica]|uniref:Uncharacterized protein n=1 Tax=Rhodopirellula islandica TaxID=595434 RepID=A0A0J1B4T2_RHOIS|nr:hypothetical protein RISK_006034 [Rhodopirellula islandica]
MAATAQILKFTIYNFTFSIDLPSYRSTPVAAPRLVEREGEPETSG